MIRFGNFGKKRELEIVTTDDERLLLIDPTSEGFFDNVLGYVTENEYLKEFIKEIEEVKEARVNPFWKPIYDPSLDDGKVVFKKGHKAAVGHFRDFWLQKVEEMPVVNGKKWSIGTKYQYYSFLVWLVNSLVQEGWNIQKALTAVMLDSKELGHYWDSKKAKHHLEPTGSRKICGVYDLANTIKILRMTEWPDLVLIMEASGTYRCDGGVSLAYIRKRSGFPSNSVCWLVLS